MQREPNQPSQPSRRGRSQQISASAISGRPALFQPLKNERSESERAARPVAPGRPTELVSPRGVRGAGPTGARGERPAPEAVGIGNVPRRRGGRHADANIVFVRPSGTVVGGGHGFLTRESLGTVFRLAPNLYPACGGREGYLP